MANRRNYHVQFQGRGFTAHDFWPQGGESNVGVCQEAWRSASDYNRRKPIGRWIPPTSYSMGEFSWSWARGSCYMSHPIGYWSRYSGYLPVHSNAPSYRSQACAALGIPTSFPGDLSNRALTKARNKLKAGSIDLGVAFGERRETARFVGDKLRGMAGVIDAHARGGEDKWRILRRHLPRSFIELMRQLSSDWLSLQYALKPMMTDIHGAMTALDDHPDDDWSVTVKASAVSKHECDRLFYPPGDKNHHHARGKVLYGCKVRIDAVLDNAALHKAASLGLTNPAALAWELTRLSFVVDWAYPLGDYFSQFDALLGWTVRGYSSSNFTKDEWEFTGRSGVDVSNGWRCNQDWSCRYRRVDLSRSAGTVVPFATLPSVKDPFSKTHVMSGLALLHQAVVNYEKRRG